MTSFLRSAEFVTTIATSSAILVFSFSAYRRTKLLPFALWIASSTMTIIFMSAWYVHSIWPPLSKEDEITFSVIYRVSFIINSILGATGSIMLIQHLLAKFYSNPPSEK
jgi:hypothetical protein